MPTRCAPTRRCSRCSGRSLRLNQQPRARAAAAPAADAARLAAARVAAAAADAGDSSVSVSRWWNYQLPTTNSAWCRELDSPIGPLLLVGDNHALQRIDFVNG